jgi:PAS domain S-box-containing protein
MNSVLYADGPEAIDTNFEPEEEAMRQSHNILRAVFEETSDAFFVKDLQGRYLMVNSACARFLSKSPDEIVGKDDTQLYPPETARHFRSQDRIVIAAGKSQMFEGSATAVGATQTYLVTKRPYKDEQGNVIGLIGISHNITARKRAEEAMRESQEEFRTLFEHIPIGIYRTTPEGHILMANPTLIRMLGYSSFDELASRSLEEIYEPTYQRSEFKEMFARDDEIRGLESTWVRCDRSVIFVRENARAVRGRDGTILYYEGTVEDITTRKAIEESLQRAQEEYRELYETAPFGYHEINGEGIIVRVNQTEADLLGYSKDEMIGRPVFDFVNERETSREAIREKIKGKRGLFGFERQYRRKDGNLIDVYIQDRLLVDDQGRTVGIRSTVQDITERKKAEEKLVTFATRLEQSNRELQDFASVASHDLQEPLRKIQAFGDRLKTKCSESLSDVGRDYVERMQNAAQRMQTLINDLLTFSRVSSKAQCFKPIDLTKVAHEVISDLETSIEQSRGRVEVGDLPTIDADPLQIRQLLQNLIGNALKFHREEELPVVKIYGRLLSEREQHLAEKNLTGEFCELRVEDNGIGFDEKYLGHIFTVFQRLHGRDTYEGTGVGLAVCRKIAERHGGIITAKSTPGQGSTFIVTLLVKQTQGENV